MIENRLNGNVLVWPKEIGIEGNLIQEYLADERMDLYISSQVAEILTNKLVKIANKDQSQLKDLQTLKSIIRWEDEEIQYKSAFGHSG
ncbi:MAG: hypothetical protein KAJ07_05820 [Planctomycetes bacterium]|nr:hypothetical protein [Planctomycetota bacterium]